MFSESIIRWQQTHGRHNLPWQSTRDAYRVWLSEVMLQQTQVATVVPFYQRFIERFPGVEALAAAELSDVLSYWSGLGYYSRARNLHRCARTIVAEHGGRFPRSSGELARLPGIGRSTAAAIAALAFGEQAAILDGNVKRVLARHFGISGYPGAGPVARALWAAAEAQLPVSNVAAYTQGLMDLGSTLCTRSQPKCPTCPVGETCRAFRDGRTADVPAARPPRVRSRKTATLALIADRSGAVLLERRALQGIWGGLLSPPEFAADVSDTELMHEIERRFALDARVVGRLEPVQHEFSHFSFEMRPCLLRTAGGPAAARDSASFQWLGIDRIEAAALPSPIRRLLLDLPRSMAAT
jgi:A/G-specific adenine glycosylase